MKAELLAYLNPEEEIKQNHDIVVKEESSSTGDLPWEKKEESKKTSTKKSEKKFVLSTEKTDIDKKIDDLFEGI